MGLGASDLEFQVQGFDLAGGAGAGGRLQAFRALGSRFSKEPDNRSELDWSRRYTELGWCEGLTV